MKPIDNFAVMARFGIDYHNWSQYGHVVVSFSIVKSANYYDIPQFAHHDFELPKSLVGIENLLISAQVAKQDILSKGLIDAHYAYCLSLDLKQPSLDHKLDSTIRAGKRIQRKVQKLADTEGYAGNIAEYLKLVFRAMNVKYITHESYSQARFNQKWKGYKIADIPTIIERCTHELSEQLHWNLPNDIAA